MNVRIFVLTMAVLFQMGAVSQQPFKETVTKLRMEPDYKNASTGIYISDIQNNSTLYNLSGDKLLIPASITKLITSASALEIPGPGYRFRTKSGFTGELKDSVLTGDIILVGNGDSNLDSEYFIENYNSPDFMEPRALNPQQKQG